MRGSAIRSERLRGTCNDKEPRPQADLSSQRRELLLHCRWNESQVSLLNHRNTRPRLRRHRQRIDSVYLKKLADTSVAKAVIGELNLNRLDAVTPNQQSGNEGV